MTCKYCERGDIPDKRLGWFWHWDDLVKGLVRCTGDSKEYLDLSLEHVKTFEGKKE